MVGRLRLASWRIQVLEFTKKQPCILDILMRTGGVKLFTLNIKSLVVW